MWVPERVNVKNSSSFAITFRRKLCHMIHRIARVISAFVNLFIHRASDAQLLNTLVQRSLNVDEGYRSILLSWNSYTALIRKLSFARFVVTTVIFIYCLKTWKTVRRQSFEKLQRRFINSTSHYCRWQIWVAIVGIQKQMTCTTNIFSVGRSVKSIAKEAALKNQLKI